MDCVKGLTKWWVKLPGSDGKLETFWVVEENANRVQLRTPVFIGSFGGEEVWIARDAHYARDTVELVEEDKQWLNQ